MFTRFAAFALAMASLSQGLSFLVTRSELCSQGCHLTWGGALSIVSIGLLFALSIAMLQIPGIEQIEASEQQEKDASTVKTLSPAVEAINPSRNAEDIDTEKAVTINAMTEDGTPIRILAGKP